MLKIIFCCFFCDFEHIKTGFRRFKILVLTVDIKSISGLRHVSPAYLSGSIPNLSVQLPEIE